MPHMKHVPCTPQLWLQWQPPRSRMCMPLTRVTSGHQTWQPGHACRQTQPHCPNHGCPRHPCALPSPPGACVCGVCVGRSGALATLDGCPCVNAVKAAGSTAAPSTCAQFKGSRPCSHLAGTHLRQHTSGLLPTHHTNACIRPAAAANKPCRLRGKANPSKCLSPSQS